MLEIVFRHRFLVSLALVIGGLLVSTQRSDATAVDAFKACRGCGCEAVRRTIYGPSNGLQHTITITVFCTCSGTAQQNACMKNAGYPVDLATGGASKGTFKFEVPASAAKSK